MGLRPTGLDGYSGTLEVIISSGQTESAILDTGGSILCGVFIPASFTGTAISFETAETKAGTYVPVAATTDGGTLTYTVAAGTYCAIDPKDTAGIQFLKIKSGSSEAADRTLACALKGF